MTDSDPSPSELPNPDPDLDAAIGALADGPYSELPHEQRRRFRWLR
jgi:hypothetical protein